MIRPNASWVVAAMEHAHSARDGAELKLVRYAMRFLRGPRSVDADSAISSASINAAGPEPAVAALVDVLPKPIGERNRLPTHVITFKRRLRASLIGAPVAIRSAIRGFPIS